MNKEEMITLGADIAHWPTHERFPVKPGMKAYGDIVGIIYDTTEWPVPKETYHPDNWITQPVVCKSAHDVQVSHSAPPS